MKFSLNRSGHFALLLSASILVSSCNQEEYFPTQELFEGADAYCHQAQDVNSCQAISFCQPAYEPSEDETAEPVFSACVANPDQWSPDAANPEDLPDPNEPTDPTDPTDPSDPTDPTDPADPSDPTDPSEPTEPSTPVEEPAPTIPEVISAKCENLDPQYLLVIKEIKKKKVVKETKKVKVCHQTGNGSEHTIVIACPALKAHKNHHDDYIGACNL